MNFIKRLSGMVFASLMLMSTASAIITVGSGGIGVCDHDNLFDAYEDAIANNDHFIRVTSEITMHDTFTISEFIQITGGYDNCGDADTNTPGTNLSQWDGDNQDTVVKLNVNTVLPLVLIENFRIFNGRNISSSESGGIRINKGNLTIVNSLIEQNIGDEGGGIGLSGNESHVTIHNTKISANTATYGGGIQCISNASVTMTGNSVILLNSANNNGGGIHGSHDCQITINNGNPTTNPIFGINGNQADFGGGVYLSNSAIMTISGNDSNPAHISNNFSINPNAQFAGGGGIFLTDNGTRLTATNTYITGNSAVNYGGGMVVEQSAFLEMNRLNTPCWDNDKCSSLSDNGVSESTGNSGAGFIDFGGTAHISQTFISNNRANSRALFRLEDFSHLRLEGNVITNNKGLSGIATQSLFEVRGNLGSQLSFYYNTLVGNNAFVMFNLNGNSAIQELRIYNSIIRDQGNIIFTSGANTPSVEANCNILHETNSLIGTLTDNFISDPSFVDAANDDFHLADNSSGRDLCSENIIQSQYKDLNGNDRGLDDPSIPALRGNYEPGAYERQLVISDIIFKNGFE